MAQAKIMINGKEVKVGYPDTYNLVRAPIGTIVIWSGTVDNVPKGWHICDGTDETPDLRDKFVLGAGETHQVGDNGGEEEVTLTKDQLPAHTHTIPAKQNTDKFGTDVLARSHVSSGSSYNAVTNVNTSTNQPHNNMPPYYTLLYIMKLEKDETDIESGGISFTTDDTLTMSEENVLGVTIPTKSVTKEQFDVMKDDEKKGLVVVVDEYKPIIPGTGEVYSEEEIRIGTWIDGKPLYRRVFKFTTSSTADTWADFGKIDDLGTMVSMNGWLIPTEYSETYMPLNYHDPNNLNIHTRYSKSKGWGVMAGAITNRPGILICEYTKSID